MLLSLIDTVHIHVPLPPLTLNSLLLITHHTLSLHSSHILSLHSSHIYTLSTLTPPPLPPQKSPDVALSIFTEDQPEVESLPRQQVLDHLTSVAPNFIIPYLVCMYS